MKPIYTTFFFYRFSFYLHFYSLSFFTVLFFYIFFTSLLYFFLFSRHFDPNDSGSVHSGEFIWAFFNRRYENIQKIYFLSLKYFSFFKIDIIEKFPIFEKINMEIFSVFFNMQTFSFYEIFQIISFLHFFIYFCLEKNS